MEALQEQTRKNLAMFEQAVSMFSPFATTSDTAVRSDGSAQSEKKSSGDDQAKRRSKAESRETSDELAALRDQLTVMQKQLDSLSKSK